MGFSVDHGGSSGPLSTLYALRLLSFLSGCAALIYEIVWFQLLQLIIGSTSVSLGVLLGTFMGGMCLGSLVIPCLISRRWNPLRACALLEAGIGLMGLLILLVLPEVSVIYSSHTSSGTGGIIFRGLLASACLLPPTILMGATLPLMGRSIGTTREGVSNLGSLYGCNIAGAVCGCLLAGFYLLRVYDMGVATYVAATINGTIAIAAAAWTLIKFRQIDTEPESEVAPVQISRLNSEPGKSLLAVYVAIGISGATALGAEVIWTRLLSLVLGSTVYTFSIILAVFLIGIGVGSHFGTLVARRTSRPGFALGVCQFLLTIAIAWTAYMLSDSLPYWPAATRGQNPWLNFQLGLSHCLWAMLPATLLWGASFPLALAAASRGQEPGRLFGSVAAANTLGGILGGVGFSVALIPVQGMQYGQRILVLLATFAAILMWAPRLWELRNKSPFAFAVPAALALIALIGVPALSALSVSKIPSELLVYGRNARWQGTKSELLFAGEGNNYPVGVSRIWNSHVRMFHVSGKVEASTFVQDMRLQRMLGHLPALLHPKPQSVLIVGCGAGVTAGTFTLHPDVKKIVICELEPLVPQIAGEYFRNENYGVLGDRRTELVYDDARHYILTTGEKFDIITSDPIHPWVKGSATLYTKEYFNLVKAHLNRGGIVTQWVPLYQSDVEVVKSELATFFEAFPNGTLWSSDQPGRGSDIVMLGQYGGCQVRLNEMQQRLEEAGYTRVAQSLKEVGFHSAIELCAGYSGRASDLTSWLQDAQINHDRNLRLEYLAGFTLNEQSNNPIYHTLLAYRKFPGNLFLSTPQEMEELTKLMFPSSNRSKGNGG